MELLSIFLITAYNVNILVPPEVLSLENWIKTFIRNGKHAFFLSNTSKVTLQELEAFELSTGNILLGCGFGVIYFFHKIGYNSSDACCLTAVATLWLAVKNFCEKSFQSLDLYLTEVNGDEKEAPMFLILNKNVVKSYEKNNEIFVSFLESYIKLKKLASKVNESFGELFFMRPIAICFLYATNVGRIFSSKGWVFKTIMYYILVKNTALLILSADICHQVTIVHINM